LTNLHELVLLVVVLVPVLVHVLTAIGSGAGRCWTVADLQQLVLVMVLVLLGSVPAAVERAAPCPNSPKSPFAHISFDM
jgi:hypothetical protein